VTEKCLGMVTKIAEKFLECFVGVLPYFIDVQSVGCCGLIVYFVDVQSVLFCGLNVLYGKP
jgi:hypothetical protein